MIPVATITLNLVNGAASSKLVLERYVKVIIVSHKLREISSTNLVGIILLIEGFLL